MVVTLIILVSILCGLLTGLIYYKGKYWNYQEIAEAAQKSMDASIEESDRTIQNMQNRLAKEKKNFKNKCQKDFKKKLIKISEAKESELEEKYKVLAKELEQEYDEACEDIKNELFEQLKVVDDSLAEHAKNLAMKNILTFSCSCSKDLIPCPIDFSKENTFICPRCGSKYKIIINANPVLIGRSISDEEFAELVEERLNDSKRKN